MTRFLAVWLVMWAMAWRDVSSDVTVPVANHWNGGFQANVCFDITDNMNQWTITLHFDQPITSIEAYTADAHMGADNTVWTLTNKNYNGLEHVGDRLCQGFQGHGSGDISPTITATLDGVTGGGSVVQHRFEPPLTFPSALEAVADTFTTDNKAVVLMSCPYRLLVVPVAMGGGIPGTLTVTQDWGDRFEGSFTFHVTEDVEGWMANITFSRPVRQMDIQVGRPYSHSEDGLTWIVVNNQDRPFYKAGDTIDMRFFGNYGGTHGANDHAPSGTAVLYNLGIDRNSSCACDPNTATSKYNYDCLLKDSILFYTIQRSGKLPTNNRIGWRGDSALNDRGDNGEDLTGGWYDAGDHVKFNFPMAYSTVILNWGYLRFKDAYDAAGQSAWLLDCVKWPLDYLLKCYIPNDVSDPNDDVLYVQVGNGGADHSYWGPPELMTMDRPAYKVDAAHPGCDVSMETAAAFASGAMVFNQTDKVYSDTLLEKAKLLWKFAVAHLGKYSDSVQAANAYYPAYNYTDEMCWGSMWLYKATGDAQYLAEAKKWFDDAPDWGMSWDDKVIACQLMLYEATGEDKYKQAAEGTFHYWLPGGTIQYTPKGLAWRLQWAPLRYASNMAMMALLAADDGINAESYRHWAMCQIHYTLGDTGFSYVVGFGDQAYPMRAHHRGASCPLAPAPCGPQIMSSNAPNVHTLCGALVGGPDSSDGYKDERSNYVMNEVACDYNAGFQTAVAGLRSLLIHNLHPEQTGSAQCPFTRS